MENDVFLITLNAWLFPQIAMLLVQFASHWPYLRVCVYFVRTLYTSCVDLFLCYFTTLHQLEYPSIGTVETMCVVRLFVRSFVENRWRPKKKEAI
jgi:hypothetical protein